MPEVATGSVKDVAVAVEGALASRAAGVLRIPDDVLDALVADLGIHDEGEFPASVEQLPARSLITCFGRDPQGDKFQKFVPPQRAAEAFRLGYTVVVEDVRLVARFVGALSQALRDEVGYAPHPGAVAMSISPAGEAVPLHYDGLETLAVQVAGSKTWRYGKAGEVEFPSHSLFFDSRTTGGRDGNVPAPGYVPETLDSATELEAREFRPGDGLVLGRGWWHETAVPTSCPMSVGLIFKMPSVSLAHHVGDLAKHALSEVSEFRRPLLGAWAVDSDVRDAARAEYEVLATRALEAVPVTARTSGWD